MSFDPIAAAVDWLDAYRAGDIEAILKMHANDAVVECSCCVIETVTNTEHFRRFWTERFEDCAAAELVDLQPIADAAFVSYDTADGLAHAIHRIYSRW